LDLYSHKCIFGSHRLVIRILLALLGWMGAFAQSGKTPGFLNLPAQRIIPPQLGEPEFTFVRAVYTGLGLEGYYKAWYTDWPKAIGICLNWNIGAGSLSENRHIRIRVSP
jgi:hypothetical protein